MKPKVMRIRAKVGLMEFEEVDANADGHIALDVVREAVGGLIERVSIDRPGCEGLDLWLNEEGKLKSLPINMLATWLSEIWRYGDFIVGDILVCGFDGEGNSVGLTEEQIQTLKGIVCK